MGLKRRNKTSAEFSMASLTDIIFLLLIFFMLTSNIAGIPNMELPESDSKTVVAARSLKVTISKKGEYTYNGKTVSSRKLERTISRELGVMENRKEATLTIAAEKGVPFRKVAALMQFAANKRIKAIIATSPRQR